MKTALTQEIEKALAIHLHKIGVYGCNEVQIGGSVKLRGQDGKELVDYITYDEKENIFRCYEIKISKEDLNSKCALSFVGDYNYLVVPEALEDEAFTRIEESKEFCWCVGIITYKKGKFKHAKKANKKHCGGDAKEVLKWSMFRSLARNSLKYMMEME